MLEKDLEKMAIEEIEAAGMSVFKTPKFSDRKHAQRKVDLGAPDLWFFYRGRTIALEMKVPGGRLSDEQKAFKARIQLHKIPHFVAYSLDDVDYILMAIKQL